MPVVRLLLPVKVPVKSGAKGAVFPAMIDLSKERVLGLGL
jgi:hypothetical protein